jgi:hypothetical protein
MSGVTPHVSRNSTVNILLQDFVSVMFWSLRSLQHTNIGAGGATYNLVLYRYRYRVFASLPQNNEPYSSHGHR